MLSNHVILCLPLLLLPSIFPSIRVFSNESALRISGQGIGALVSASVLPMNIQDWFPLELTGLISLQSRGVSRVFSSTIIQRHQPLALSLLYGPALTSIHNYWKNHSFDYTNLCWQSDERERKIDSCTIMDESLFCKWEKGDTNDWMLYDSICMKLQKR